MTGIDLTNGIKDNFNELEGNYEIQHYSHFLFCEDIYIC